MKGIWDLKPSLDAKKESHNVTCRTPFAEGEGFLSNSLSSPDFPRVPYNLHFKDLRCQ